MSDTEALQKTEGPAPANVVADQIDRHEKALLQGDLSDLSRQERKSFYESVCESLGLNPLTKPLEYIWLSGDLTLYANKTAANQLRDLNGVSITDLDIQQDNGLHTVYAFAEDEAGRTDVDAGIVDVSGASGENLANARMKAITKAKRRVTLSICGLGFLDETEVEDIPDGATKAANVDHETGELRERKSDKWYEEAKELLKDKVREGMDPAQILAYADEAPTSHPIDDWPEEEAEPLIEWLKEGDRPGESGSGKSSRNGSAQATKTSPTDQENGTHSGTQTTTSDDSGKAQGAPSAPKSKSQKSQSGETNSRPNGGQAKESGTDGGNEHPQIDYEDADDALNTIFSAAWKTDENAGWDSISEKQLNRLYAIAGDNDWEESGLNRLIKDELGWESKADLPYGDPYDEVCAALEDERLRYFMHRDPDTPDMFSEGVEDKEVPL